VTPTSPALRPPIQAEPTHPCARCGAPVGPGIGLCERCNPLGLRDVASGQVHGSVFIAVSLAIAILAIAARLAVAGIGPFPAAIDGVTATDRGLAVTLTVTNEGAAGGTSCRISLPDDRGVGMSAFVTTPRLGSHETKTFTSVITEFGTTPREFVVACRTP
jgi:hypothetical protein